MNNYENEDFFYFLFSRSVSNSNVCEGEKEMVRICDNQKCNQRQDIRQQQCYQLPKVMNFGAKSWQFNSTWFSYISDDTRNSCKLTCRSKESGQILYTNVNLIDGTPCSYTTTNICIQVSRKIVSVLKVKLFCNR